MTQGETSKIRLRPLRLLFLVPGCIYPVSHGGASRITSVLWGLTERGHAVHVLSLVGSRDEQVAVSGLPRVASSESILIRPKPSYLRGSSTPSSALGLLIAGVSECLAQIAREHSIDILQLEYTHAAAYLDAVPGLPVVLTEHDVAFVSRFRGLRFADTPGAAFVGLIEALRLYRWELKQAKRADLLLTTSERDADFLRLRGVTRVTGAVPNGVEVARLQPRGRREETSDLLFVGNFRLRPNIDGLGYFLSEIWPSLAEQRRGLSMSVVGPRLAPDLVDRAAALGITYAGYVQDLAAEFWSHKVLVVPIRYGSGTRVKVLEAAAAKCAIVSTTLGVEGIGLEHGSQVLIADDPPAFTKAVIKLLDDADLRASLGSSAHDMVKNHYDWPVLIQRQESLYYDLLGWE